MIYSIYLFLSLALLAHPHRISTGIRYVFASLIFLLFFFISALRWDVGSDWQAYYDFYTEGHHFDSYFEPGYKLIAVVISRLNLDYIWFQLVVSMAVFLPLLPLLKNKMLDSQIYILGFGSVFFVTYMGGQRSSIAISIAFLAFWALLRKKDVKFLLLCLLAAMFHVSLAILIVFYFLLRLITIKQLWIILFASLFVGFYIADDIMPGVGAIFGIEKFISYAGREAVSVDYDFLAKDLLIMVERLFSIALLTKYYLNIKAGSLVNNDLIESIGMLLKFAMFSAIIFFMFHESVRMIAGRGSLMFRIPELFLWSFFFGVQIKKKGLNFNVFARLAFCLYAAIKTYITFMPEYYSQYKTVFNL